MRVLLAAGGTGGHVIPAIVVAQELASRNPECRALFVGTAKGVENRLVPQAGFPLRLIGIGAWQGQGLGARLRNLAGAPRALWQAFQIVRQFQPDVVLGIGGYASGPIMLAAALSGVPLAILEPNAFPGLANRWMAPYVSRALIAFPETASYFRAGSSRLTGIPVRKEFFKIPPKRHDDGSPFTVLIFGGSQGARSLNRATVEALPRLAQLGKEIALIHQTGQTEYNSVREAYEKYPVPAEVIPYTDKMAEAFARADLVVCRAGANTVAELAAASRASVLVPFPAAANEHQLRNAEALVNAGAARLIVDRHLNGDTFFSAIQEMRSRPDYREQMENRIKAFAHPEATGAIADEVERLARLSGGQTQQRH